MSRQIEIEEPVPKDGFNLLDLQKFFLWIQNLCDQYMDYFSGKWEFQVFL